MKSGIKLTLNEKRKRNLQICQGCIEYATGKNDSDIPNAKKLKQDNDEHPDTARLYGFIESLDHIQTVIIANKLGQLLYEDLVSNAQKTVPNIGL